MHPPAAPHLGPDDRPIPSVLRPEDHALRTRLTESITVPCERLDSIDGIPLSFTCLFLHHRSASDSRQIQEYFDSADIVIPEGAGWPQEVLQALRDVSDGSLDPQAFIHSCSAGLSQGFASQLISMLYCSRKPVTIFDVPKDHTIYKEYNAYSPHLLNAETFRRNLRLPYEDNFDFYRRSEALMAEFGHARDLYMASAAGNQLRLAMQAHPQLASKQEISVLTVLGAAHETFAERMSLLNTRVNVVRTSGDTPNTSLAHQYKLGRDPDRQTAAPYFFDDMFSTALAAPLLNPDVDSDTARVCNLTYEIGAALTPEGIKRMYEDIVMHERGLLRTLLAVSESEGSSETVSAKLDALRRLGATRNI